MTVTTQLAARPRLGDAESAVGLLVRCAIANGRPLENRAWWTDETTTMQGVRALLVGEEQAVHRLAGLLGRSDSEISRGTLRHLASFNTSRVSAVMKPTGYVSRAQQDKGPTTLALPRVPKGSAKPAFVHGWRVPYCPDCLRRQPQSWPLQHHLALPGVCLQDQRILLLGCGRCGGAGITAPGQIRRPGHCTDCQTDLRRAQALPLHFVDGLEAAATRVTVLLGHDTTQHHPDLLAGVLDVLTLGLISDPPALRGTATASLRRNLMQARNIAEADRRPLRLAYQPQPAHVAAYLPLALAIAQSHLDEPATLSPLVTLHGLETMTPYDCFLGSATRNRIRHDRRRLHHVLAGSAAGSRLIPRVPIGNVPRLLPVRVYESHLADLAEPLISATSWPSTLELRHALARQLNGELGWHRQQSTFSYGRSHEYHDECVLHAVQEALTAAGFDDHWAVGLTAAAEALAAAGVDWQLRHDLLRDDRVLAGILKAVPAADPDEAHRWLHQVWASTTEPALGLYGPDLYLLEGGQTSSRLAAQLETAADRLSVRARHSSRERRA